MIREKRDKGLLMIIRTTFFIGLAFFASGCENSTGRITAQSPEMSQIRMNASEAEGEKPQVTAETKQEAESGAHRLDRVHVSFFDTGDMGTTAAGIWSGAAEEANPLLSWSGDAVPFVGLGLKYGAKKGLVTLGVKPARANVSINTGSAIGTCANILTLTGAAPQVAIPAGLICGLLYNRDAKKRYEDATGKTLDGGALHRSSSRPLKP